MFHPRFIKIYALTVTVLSVVVLLLFLGIAGIGMWYIANPAVTELKDFTFEQASGGAVQLGLKNENKHIFQNIDMEDFRKRPDYYYNIAKADYAPRIIEITLQMMSFGLIFLIVLVVHWRLWRKMRGMGA